MVAKLKEIRKARGMTQEQLAKASGIHRVTIAKYEAQSVDPSTENAEKLGYSGVMIGRGLLGRPWALSEISGGAVPHNIGEIVLRHLAYTIEYYGARAGVPLFRKHAAWYSAGMPNSSEFRIRVNQITDADELRKEICKFWGCELNI